MEELAYVMLGVLIFIGALVGVKKIYFLYTRNNSRNKAFHEFQQAESKIGKEEFEKCINGMNEALEKGGWQQSDVNIGSKCVHEMKRRHSLIMIEPHVKALRDKPWNAENNYHLQKVQNYLAYGMISLDDAGITREEMNQFRRHLNLLRGISMRDDYVNNLRRINLSESEVAEAEDIIEHWEQREENRMLALSGPPSRNPKNHGVEG